VIIGCTVENTGTVTAVNAKLSFYLGNPLDGGEWIKDSENTTSIGPSESAHVEIAWVLDGVVGAVDICVWVDPDNEIDEISEEDNISSTSFTSATTPDLTISSADISFDNTAPLEGETFTMTAIIRNGGETDAGPITVALFDGDPENVGEKVGELTFNAIYGGSYGTATFDLALYAGSYDFYVKVDPENDIEEGSETNNIASRSITVRPIEFQGIDLAISSSGISFIPLYPREGDTITISAIIRNSGDRDAHDVGVKLYDGNPISGTQLVEHTYSTIMSGHEKTLTLTANFPEGSHEIYVVVDPDNTLQEISEINNTAQKTLTIMPPGEVIDLAVTTDDIRFEPQVPEVGEEVTIVCGIRNAGTVRVENVKVRIYEGNPTAGGRLLYPEFTISFIDAGVFGSITIHHDTTDWGGDHLIYVVADPENAIIEEDEENNRASRILTVSSLGVIDVAVTAAGITFNPAEPVTGDSVTVNCVVENIGDENVSQADVSFYVDGQLLGDDTAADIPAGGSAPASISWDTTSLPGVHIISVVVDLSNTIPEINEFNNEAEKEITVKAPNLSVSADDLNFSNPAPLQGETFTLTAVVHNIGDIDTEDITAALYDGDPEGGGIKLDETTIGPISAGSTDNAVFSLALDTGTYKLYVAVDPQNVIVEANEKNNIAARSITVIPEPSNYPPEIISEPVTVFLFSTQNYSYDFEAIDPDDDILTYSLDEFPEGMTIDSETGLMIWEPGEEQVGNHPVTVRVEDPEGLFDTQSFIIIIGEDRNDAAVRCGVEWLKNHQDDKGGWIDYGDGKYFSTTTATVMSLRALAITDSTNLPVFELIRQRVYELQATNGSWDNNEISTGEAVQALIASEQDPNSDVIRRAVAWLKLKQDDDGSWWSDLYGIGNPWYTGLAIKALIDAGEDKHSNVIQQAKQWLIDNQKDDGYWSYRKGATTSGTNSSHYPLIGLVLASSPDNQAEQQAIADAVDFFRTHYDEESTADVIGFLTILNHTNGSSAEISSTITILKNLQCSDGG